MTLYPPGPSTYDAATYDVYAYDSFSVGAPRVELLINSVWTDITSYARVAQGISIKRGRQDWSQTPTFATCAMTLGNRDGRFSPRNPSGAYFGFIGRNTQIRVSVILDDGSTVIRFWGDVSEWPVSWDKSGRESVVSIVASGLRRRLQQGAIPLQSPYRIAAGALTTLQAYWPLEDGGTTQQFGSALSTGLPMFAGGATVTPMASNDFSAASTELPSLVGCGANVAGTVRRWTLPVTGQQVRMLIEVDSTTALMGVDIVCRLASGDAIVCEYVPVANTLEIAYKNPDGTNVSTSGAISIASSQPWTTGSRISIESVQSGADVNYGVAWLNTGQTSGFSLVGGGTLAVGTTLTPVAAVSVINGGTPGVQDITTIVGHVTVESGKTSIFDLLAVLDGYAGESALTRANRLAVAAGITPVISNGSSRGITSALVGVQGENTLLELIDDAMFVDTGISTEDVPTRTLAFRSLGNTYDNFSGLTLTYTQVRFNDLQTADDDQLTVNDITANRPNGGTAHYQQTSGTLSVTAVGDYQQAVSINTYRDDQLLNQAQWRVAIGTQDFPRWPRIGFDAKNLLSSGQRITLVGLREGDVFTIASLPAFAGASSADVQIAGWTETITQTTWQFDMNCVTADLIQHVFLLDSATKGILDTDRLAL